MFNVIFSFDWLWNLVANANVPSSTTMSGGTTSTSKMGFISWN